MNDALEWKHIRQVYLRLHGPFAAYSRNILSYPHTHKVFPVAPPEKDEISLEEVGEAMETGT